MSASGMALSSWTGAGDGFGSDRLVAGAALREQESNDVLQGLGVGRVAKEGAFAAHGDEAFVLQLVEMMRERRRRDAKLRADLADDQPFRMRGQQQPHDPEPRFGAQGRKHVGVAGNLVVGTFWHSDPYFHNYGTMESQAGRPRGVTKNGQKLICKNSKIAPQFQSRSIEPCGAGVPSGEEKESELPA